MLKKHRQWFKNVLERPKNTSFLKKTTPTFHFYLFLCAA